MPELSDTTLGYWSASAETVPPGELGTINWPWVAKTVIEELRATRSQVAALRARLDELESTT